MKERKPAGQLLSYKTNSRQPILQLREKREEGEKWGGETEPGHVPGRK